MQPVPDNILTQLNALLEQKAVPPSLRDDYRKWLCYYLDYRYLSLHARQISTVSRGQQHHPAGNPGGHKKKERSDLQFLP